MIGRLAEERDKELRDAVRCFLRTACQPSHQVDSGGWSESPRAKQRKRFTRVSET